MFSSHQITTTGIDRKTIKEKRYLQRKRVSQTRRMQKQSARLKKIRNAENKVHSRKQLFFTIIVGAKIFAYGVKNIWGNASMNLNLKWSKVYDFVYGNLEEKRRSRKKLGNCKHININSLKIEIKAVYQISSFLRSSKYLLHIYFSLIILHFTTFLIFMLFLELLVSRLFLLRDGSGFLRLSITIKSN